MADRHDGVRVVCFGVWICGAVRGTKVRVVPDHGGFRQD